jgi:predicted Rossmann fold nucleotide-binding protein DprA/Smf involved in DNA uptake
MAVPGPAQACRSRGANGLLKRGAHLVECAEDVAEIVEPLLMTRPFLKKSGHLKSDWDMDTPLLRALRKGHGAGVNELAEATGMKASLLLAELTRLAVAGVVEEMAGRRWRIRESRCRTRW